MCCRFSLIIFFVCLIIATSKVEVAAQDGKSAIVDRVVKAWQARESRFQTWDISWTGTGFRSKFSVAIDAKRTNPKGIPDISFPYKVRLICAGADRIRSEYEGKNWSLKRGELVPFKVINICDGKSGITYFPWNQKYKIAYIAACEAAEDANDIQTIPLFIFLRPFGQPFGKIDPTKLELVTTSAEINGTRCCLLKFRRTNQNDLIWVETSKDYLPIRYSWSRPKYGDVPDDIIDIEYAYDETNGWFPVSWTNRWLTLKGAVYEKYTARVTDARINATIPEDMFKLEFPVGTWVENRITKESYILKAGGGKRIVLPGEFTGDNYEQLLNTDPHARTNWLIAIGVIAVIAVVALAILRNYLRRRSLARKHQAT